MKENNNPKSITGNPIIGMKNNNSKPKTVKPNQTRFNFESNSNFLSEKKEAKPLDACIFSNAGFAPT